MPESNRTVLLLRQFSLKYPCGTQERLPIAFKTNKGAQRITNYLF